MRYDAPHCPWCPSAIRAWRQGQIWDRGRGSSRVGLNGPAEARFLAAANRRRAAREMALTEPAGYENATRIAEIVEFAKGRGYRKIGIATCGGFGDAAQALCRALERGGFGVVSIETMPDNMLEEDPWLPEFRDLELGQTGSRCNPVAQAKLLNAEGCDFNVAVGLCVGCDSLFFRHAEAPTTALHLGSRVLDHDASLALDFSYLRRHRTFLAE